MLSAETGRAFAAIVPTLPDRTADELRRLLAYDHLAGSSIKWRERRLGLLVRMLAQLDGQLPNCAAYDELRRTEDSGWPSASQLSRSYGIWLRALAVAASLLTDERDYGAPKQRLGVDHSNYRSRQECAVAILACEAALGASPIQQEYIEWRRISSDVTRRFGRRSFAVPQSSTILHRFGDWEHAIEFAHSLKAASAAGL